jgi:hypothetical protein
VTTNRRIRLPLTPTRTRHRSTFGFIVLVAALVVAVGAGVLSQWKEAVVLRTERDLGRFEMRDWARLRAENARLRESQISAAELETLRADHAALPRLRAELDALSRR